jgi:hypothetical protein
MSVFINDDIPEQQFGFRKGKSTLGAIENLLDEIEKATRQPGGELYSMFIYYTNAFDLLDRTKLIKKIERMTGEAHPMLRIVRNIMAYKHIVMTSAHLENWSKQTVSFKTIR